MSRRIWFVSLSVTAHAALGFGVFASGIWDLERLERDSRGLSTLAVMAPPPAPSGGGLELPAQTITPKPRQITKDLTQPAVAPEKPDAAKPTQAATGDGTGTGTGAGPDGPGDDDDVGTCLTPPCGDDLTAPPAKPEPRPEPVPEPPKAITPNELTAIRTSGNTQIHPSEVTKNQMLRDGKTSAVGVVKVCISESGKVSEVSLLRPTKYADYDRRLLDGVRGWTYRPYVAQGRHVKVCGTVTFQYSIK